MTDGSYRSDESIIAEQLAELFPDEEIVTYPEAEEVTPTYQEPYTPDTPVDIPDMVLAYELPLAIFEAQNKLRTDPRSYLAYIENEEN